MKADQKTVDDSQPIKTDAASKSISTTPHTRGWTVLGVVAAVVVVLGVAVAYRAMHKRVGRANIDTQISYITDTMRGKFKHRGELNARYI